MRRWNKIKHSLFQIKKFALWEPDRPALRKVKKYFKGQQITGAEIGVFFGDNAKDILIHIPEIKKLYLVDPYKYVIGESSFDDPVLDLASKYAVFNLISFKKKIEILYGVFDSDEILKMNRGKLDFVYIDGDHFYDAVKADIIESKKAVQERGIIAGHDFDYPGVALAVAESFKNFKVLGTEWIAYLENEKMDLNE